MNTIEIGLRLRDARERKKLSQEDVADAIGGVGQSTVQRIEAGDWKRIPSALGAYATHVGMKLEDLDPELAGVPAAPASPPNLSRVIMSERDFPIYASAQGGAGELIRMPEPVDWYPRPAPLALVRDAYGLIIVGESMIPEFDPADIALVNPHLPPLAGRAMIFYAERDGEARVTIKRYLRASPREWIVQQHNPKKELHLVRKEWSICHRVLGKYYP